MSAAEKIAPMISEPLTWAEICERYPEQWVCLVEIDRPRRNNFTFHTARVVGHGSTRREPLVQARPWWDSYREIGHYFTGRIVAPAPRFLAWGSQPEPAQSWTMRPVSNSTFQVPSACLRHSVT